MDLVERAKRTEKIRALNDEFRTNLGEGCIYLTEGVKSFHGASEVLVKVFKFDAFTENNDPHGEHDFGAFEFRGERFMWKIDYYDTKVEFGSEDPADPEKTTRVLTVMLASEY